MSAELLEVLHDPQVTKNIRQMFKVGLEDCHESAFAVYDVEPGYSVSKLLLPRIVSTDLFHQATWSQHTSINTVPLTHIEPSEDESATYTEAMMMVDHETLSDKAKRIIARIKSEDNLSNEEREYHIDVVVKRDLGLVKPVPVLRNDLKMVAHNHPIVPLFPDTVAELRPSSQDLVHAAHLMQGNPDIVEAVVMADGKKQGMFLFAADPRAGAQYPEQYDDTAAKSSEKVVSVLRDLGYKAVAVLLDKRGRPIKDHIEMIKDFEAGVTAFQTAEKSVQTL